MSFVQSRFNIRTLLLAAGITCIFYFIVVINAEGVNQKSPKELATEAITEIFLKRNPEAIEKYVSNDYRQHQPGLTDGKKPFKEYLVKLFSAFPDYRGEIENVVAEGDLVSFHLTWEGTHSGEFFGVPATGKKISRRTADILRVKDGKLVEHWGIVDQTDMLKALGLLVSPNGKP